MQKLVERGYALGTWGPNKDGVDGDWGKASKKALVASDGNMDAAVDFLRKKGQATGFPESEWISALSNTMRVDDHLAAQEAVLERNDPDGKVGIYLDEWGTWYDPAEGRNPGFLYQQNTRRHVPDIQSDFPEAVQPSRGHIGQVEAGGTGATDAGGLREQGAEHAEVGIQVLLRLEREAGTKQGAVQISAVGHADATVIQVRTGTA